MRGDGWVQRCKRQYVKTKEKVVWVCPYKQSLVRKVGKKKVIG